jgi:hypothetical protein
MKIIKWLAPHHFSYAFSARYLRGKKYFAMVKDIVYSEEVQDLSQPQHGPCLSMIIPTHREGVEHKRDQLALRQLTEKARLLLLEQYGKSESLPILQQLEDILLQVDFTHNEDGLGIFISPSLQRIIRFPFEVETKLMAGDNFEIRDVLYKSRLAQLYYVLVLTEKTARLLEGHLTDLKEVRDQHFPEHLVDDYLYEKPARSTSYTGYAQEKSTEKDKSTLEEIRLKSYLREVDQGLRPYLFPTTPLIVTGAKEILSAFRQITDHTDNLKGTVVGSFGKTPLTEIALLAWNQMLRYTAEQHLALLKEFEEQFGQGKATSGLHAIWNAVQEGRGRKLLVEKDYRTPGFIAHDSDALFRHAPNVPHRTLPDVIDDIIEKMLEKQGEVVMVENGLLEDYDHMALITRY